MTNAIGTSASALVASPGGSVGAEASALAKSMASTEKRMMQYEMVVYKR
jgi:hypothetical protein